MPRERKYVVFFGLFQLHYLNRAFIYPLLLKGQSKMPLGIIVMGVVFNLLNACMQGCWIFYLAPEGMYTSQWLLSPQFIAGASLFFLGMGINIHSDRIIRHLRQPGCSVTCRRPIISGKSSSGPVLPC